MVAGVPVGSGVMGGAGRVQALQRATQARLAPPQTSEINGQTYLGREAQPSLQPGESRSYANGTLWGGDGSTWTPMGGAGGSQAGAGGSGAGGSRGSSAASSSAGGYSPEPLLTDPSAMGVPPVPPPPAAFSRIQGPGNEIRAGADNANFARAHGRIGGLARGALTATRDEFNGRGISGSRSEGAAIQGVLSDAANQNADVVRDQAVEGLHREEAINDRNYAGDLGQRSADMNYAATGRAQDIGAAESRASAQSRLDALRRAASLGR